MLVTPVLGRQIQADLWGSLVGCPTGPNLWDQGQWETLSQQTRSIVMTPEVILWLLYAYVHIQIHKQGHIHTKSTFTYIMTLISDFLKQKMIQALGWHRPIWTISSGQICIRISKTPLNKKKNESYRVAWLLFENTKISLQWWTSTYTGVHVQRKSGHYFPSLQSVVQRLGIGILLGELF